MSWSSHNTLMSASRFGGHKESGQMIFGHAAYEEMVATVGKLAPETGGILFGDREGPDSFVVKKFVFDSSGTRSYVSYDPDPDIVNALIKKVWEEEGLALIGWLHSHPRGITFPSGNYGGNTGDLGYTTAILEAIPGLKKFLIPIVHSTSDGGPLVIHPYVAHRGNVANYQRAKLVVRDESMGTHLQLNAAPKIEKQPNFDRAKLDAKLNGAVDVKLLSKSRIFAVGAGGANGIYENLIRMGIGHLTLVDFDTVDASNLVTQGWFADQIGKPKVEAFKENAERLMELDGDLNKRVTGLEDNFLQMSDEELTARAKDADLLMFMTDDFWAQARGNRLALKVGKPAIFAMMYEGARCSEITFMIPGVTPSCHRCALSSRYEAYLKEGYRNDVGSEGSFIFQTQTLNSLIGLLAMAILHHGTEGFEFSNWFGDYWDRNLLQTRINPNYESGLFARVFGSEERAFAFDSIWQKIEPERPPKYRSCPDCGGAGDLTRVIIHSTLDELEPQTAARK